MSQIIKELGIGILSSIIAAIILAVIGGTLYIKNKSKSSMKISGSKVKGDIVQGDKKNLDNSSKKSSYNKRASNITVIDTEVGGDIVQGNKKGE